MVWWVLSFALVRHSLGACLFHCLPIVYGHGWHCGVDGSARSRESEKEMDRSSRTLACRQQAMWHWSFASAIAIVSRREAGRACTILRWMKIEGGRSPRSEHSMTVLQRTSGLVDSIGLGIELRIGARTQKRVCWLKDDDGNYWR